MQYPNYITPQNQKASSNQFNPSFLTKSEQNNKVLETALSCARTKVLDIHLGINAKSSSPPPKIDIKTNEQKPLGSSRNNVQSQRAERFFLLNSARRILTAKGINEGLEYPANFHQTAKCSHTRHSSQVDVHQSTKFKKSFYSGLIICGRVWTCPVCAAKIQEKRRLEIATAFDWAYSHRKKIIMVTFTFSHYKTDNLKELLKNQSKAYTLLRSGKAWQKLKEKIGFVGLIRSLEVTHGLNGWHPHTHEAWIVDKATDTTELLNKLSIRWFNCCSKYDLVNDKKEDKFLEHAVHITDNCRTSDYLAKQDDSKHWGADRELAKATSKVNKKGKGSHPFQFLFEFAHGTENKAYSAVKYLEYAQAMRGKSQLFWSTGLKDLIGINDKSDKELAEEQEDKAVMLGTLTKSDWDIIVLLNAKAHVLDLCENQGFHAVTALIENHLIEDG